MPNTSLRVPLQTLNLVASAAKTASGNSGAIVVNNPDMSNLVIRVACTAVTGTTPTLDLYFQQSLDGTNFVDVAHFTQITAALTNPTTLNLGVGGSNALQGQVGDATISANTLGTALVSNIWRVKWVIAGTNPSFTFAVNAYWA